MESALAFRGPPAAAPTAKKRPANDGDGEDEKRAPKRAIHPDGTASTKGDKDAGRLASTKALFDRISAAYRGEHTDPLGSDAPTGNEPGFLNMFKNRKCTVLFSDGAVSSLATHSTEELRFVYNTFSQNTAVEIRMGQLKRNKQ